MPSKPEETAFMTLNPLIVFTERGLYCPPGDFYIDPCKSVEHAVITHAHGDHLYKGSRQYYCSDSSLSLVQCRLPKKASITSHPYGETFFLNGVQVSFHPAGHILGSAQIRVEYNNQVWVVSGDYKRTPDPSCEPFEVVPCDVFITETTFARPVYRWEKNSNVVKEIFDWWQENGHRGQASILFCYALGKAQRILAELARHTDKPVLVHDKFLPLIQCYRDSGIHLIETRHVDEKGWNASYEGELILAPPWVLKSGWANRYYPYETAFASGWMQGQQSGYWGWQYDKGFVMSDHADWDELVQTITETGAKQVYTMPGSGRLLIQHLKQEFGISAHPVKRLKPAS
jgi:putative mRNA 3-end processing factor